MPAQLEALESLPVAEEPRPPVAGDRRRLEEARRTVLIVEDDAAQRAVLVELISTWGYRTRAAGSAEEAEELVAQQRVDAAVVDVFLPGRSGTQLIDRLREQFPEAVLIGISALSDSATARQCKGIGADLFIGKPLEPEKLAAALRSTHQAWH